MKYLPILVVLAPALASFVLAFVVEVVPFLRKRWKAFVNVPEKLDVLKDLFLGLSLAGPGVGVYLGLKEGSWAMAPFAFLWFVAFFGAVLSIAQRLADLREAKEIADEKRRNS